MSSTTRRLIISLATLLLVAMIPAAVSAAGGTFTDDDDSIFEDHIEWLADAGVTAGCNPPANDNFCPDDDVNRGQMAAFMRRFAQYIGAEDGTPAEADHAATADVATTADTATNANTVDGKSAIQFQPTTNDFDAEGSVAVNVDDKFEIVTGSVTTTDGTGQICLVGYSPTADIRVSATGHVLNLVGTDATLWLEHDGSQIAGTSRKVGSSLTPFAVEWLFESGGGTDEFRLVANEGGGDTYTVANATLMVEVISDTRCKGSGFIFVPPGLPDAGDLDAQS